MIEDFNRELNNVIAYINRKAKREKWQYRGIFIASEHQGGWHKRVNIDNGVGRPRIAHKLKYRIKNAVVDEFKNKSHGHILIKARPGETMAKDLKKYWENKHGRNTCSIRKSDVENNWGCYGWFKDYAIPQATNIRNSSYGYVGNFI